MPNPENLRPKEPWKPGQSGNPKGYPKGVPNRSTIARKVLEMRMNPPDMILKILYDLYPTLKKTLTLEEVATMIVGLKAVIDKDVQAYKALMDSAYGSPIQDITSNQQITHDITYSNVSDNELINRINKLINSASKN